jgi:hypothetical protein
MKYLENLTDTVLDAIDGRIKVARRFFTIISEDEAQHGDIIHAIRRGWAVIHDEEPMIEKPEAPEIAFTDPKKAQQMDPSELPGNKNQNAPVAPVEPTTPAAPAAPVEPAPAAPAAPVEPAPAAPAAPAEPVSAPAQTSDISTPSDASAPADATATKAKKSK